MESSKRRRFIVTCAILILAIGGAFFNSVEAKTITLKVMCMYPPPEKPESVVDIFIDRANSKAKGQLVLKFAGGMETIPLHQQAEGLTSGIIDIDFIPSSMLQGEVPEVRALALSEMTGLGTMNPKLERKTGFYDYIRDAMKKAGVYYLGRAGVTNPITILLKKEVRSMDDLSKLLIAHGSRTYGFYLKEIGVKPVSLRPPDVYSALDRGIVNGIVGPLSLSLALSLSEVTEYMLVPHVTVATSTIIAMNLDKWNSLPGSMKKVLEEAAQHAEHYAGLIDVGLRVKREHRAIHELGLKPIQLNPADAKRMQSAYMDMSWDLIKEKTSPETYQELKELTKLEK